VRSGGGTDLQDREIFGVGTGRHGQREQKNEQISDIFFHLRTSCGFVLVFPNQKTMKLSTPPSRIKKTGIPRTEIPVRKNGYDRLAAVFSIRSPAETAHHIAHHHVGIAESHRRVLLSKKIDASSGLEEEASIKSDKSLDHLPGIPAGFGTVSLLRRLPRLRRASPSAALDGSIYF
jgi:hypothetical protein